MSETEKEKRPGQFSKGDPRINRNGRPRSMDKLKKLVISKLTDMAKDQNGKPILIDGVAVTNIEAIIQASIHSKDWRRLQYLLEVAYGKVPDETVVKGTGAKDEIIIKVIRDDKDAKK